MEKKRLTRYKYLFLFSKVIFSVVALICLRWQYNRVKYTLPNYKFYVKISSKIPNFLQNCFDASLEELPPAFNG